MGEGPASRPEAPRSALLIRLIVGPVFVSEGIQKFILPAARGVGRFTDIGLPWPGVLAYTVACLEVVCGLLVLAGLFTRRAALPLFAIMVVAIVTTKIPILLGHGFWGLEVRDLSTYGFWSMAHAMRTDYAMLLGSLFLLVVGPGPLSVDHILTRRRRALST